MHNDNLPTSNDNYTRTQANASNPSLRKKSTDAVEKRMHNGKRKKAGGWIGLAKVQPRACSQGEELGWCRQVILLVYAVWKRWAAGVEEWKRGCGEQGRMVLKVRFDA